jgi:hypothetical protein
MVRTRQCHRTGSGRRGSTAFPVPGTACAIVPRVRQHMRSTDQARSGPQGKTHRYTSESTICSFTSTCGYSLATARTDSRKRPSVIESTFDLCTTVTVGGPCIATEPTSTRLVSAPGRRERERDSRGPPLRRLTVQPYDPPRCFLTSAAASAISHAILPIRVDARSEI